jgi:hypothetical protein
MNSRCRVCHFSPCRCQDLKEGFAPQVAFGKAGWPRDSDAMGCHPSQVEAAREESRRLGVPTEFRKNGSAIITSQAHQNRYSRALGLTDRSREITIPKVRTMRERSLDRVPR